MVNYDTKDRDLQEIPNLTNIVVLEGKVQTQGKEGDSNYEDVIRKVRERSMKSL